MIYVDTSVALAHLLAQDRRPPVAMWNEVLVSSRLLEFELWTRIQARGLGHSHGEHVRALIERIGFLEVVPEVVGRAAERFPAPVRTLDALHLATLDFVVRQGQRLRLAAYDARMLDVARRLGIEVYPL